MSFLSMAKEIVEKTPEPVGSLLTWVPFSWRLGPTYIQTKKNLFELNALDESSKQSWIFERLRKIITYAYGNIGFYKDFYTKNHFHPQDLRTFDDYRNIPIITKKDLQEYPIEKRSKFKDGAIRVNTGGTSGQPLEFYLDRYAFAREWAHMHFVWGQVGYNQRSTKITFRGKNLGSQAIKYNAVHNEFTVNAYSPYSEIATAIKKITKSVQIKYLHGYPSSIYEFTRYCLDYEPGVIRALRTNLKGILLGSEYPAPVYRDLIEGAYDVPSISWYGHSEMALLAYEVEKYSYAPLQSYGYCEAVPDGEGNHRLIGTSYENFVSPFIRYDTGDHITPERQDGLLERFNISSGRVGEFIVDSNGKRISLTALIFGRHHPLFGWARFVQIRQDRPGHATVLITVPEGLKVSAHECSQGFDTRNVSIDFSFEIRTEPVRTRSGKVPLLVKRGT